MKFRGYFREVTLGEISDRPHVIGLCEANEESIAISKMVKMFFSLYSTILGVQHNTIDTGYEDIADGLTVVRVKADDKIRRYIISVKEI